MKQFLLLLLFPFIICAQVQIGQDITPDIQGQHSGYSTSISADGKTVAAGCYNSVQNSTAARVYSYENGEWIQKGQTLEITQSENMELALCEVSLSSDGNTLAWGLPYVGTDANRGKVKVYSFNNTNDTWEQLGSDITGVDDTYLGFNIDLTASGNTLAVVSGGKWYVNSMNPGSVAVYEYINSEWVLKGEKITGSNLQFIFADVSLSDDGNTMVVGAAFANGSTVVYEYINNAWQLSSEPIPFEGYIGYGSSVSITGDANTMITGGFQEAGKAKIYEKVNGQWQQKGQTLTGDFDDDQFGIAVSVSSDGNLIAVGAALSNSVYSNGGRVKIYKYTGNQWIQYGQNIDGEVTYGLLGYDISLTGSGDYLAVGVPNANSYSGIVKIYEVTSVLSSDNFAKDNFTLYPNPAQSTITLSNNNAKIENIKIYNSIGQLVKTTELTTLDISGLPDGVYFAHVISGHNTVNKSFIKKS